MPLAFLPDDESGPFLLHRRSLTAEEIDVIVDWSAGGTPEGGAKGSPTADDPPSSKPSWSGGKPDSVLQPDEAVVLGEDEPEKTACVVLPTGLDGPRKLSRFEVAPGNASILRHATLFVGDSCARGEPILSWLPDRKTVSFPDGLGRELPAVGDRVSRAPLQERLGPGRQAYRRQERLGFSGSRPPRLA